jgi:Protein of unknown function (DUF3108)
MKPYLIGLSIVILLSGFLSESGKVLPITKNTSFGKGEELEYRVSFGFFTVGKAITRIDQRIYNINAKPCYKIDAWGETSDWISWVTRVKDNWGAYLDTTTLNSQVAYRKIREGRYKKDEITNYDHNEGTAEVKVLNQKSGVYEKTESYTIPKNAKDLVAGFMLLRIIDFTKVHSGDTLSIAGFYEDTAYNLRIMHMGKEVIQTKIGKIPCHKLVPIMPDNKLFDGENSITVWISDDGNKVPVKIQASMFIGHTGLELASFKGLRNQIRVIP